MALLASGNSHTRMFADRSNWNPSWKQHSWILRSAGKIQDPGRDIGDQEIGRQKSNNGGGWGIKQKPVEI